MTQNSSPDIVEAPTNQSRSALRLFRRAFLALFGIGVIGIIVQQALRYTTLVGLSAGPRGGWLATIEWIGMEVLPPFALLAVWISIGTALAPKMRLRSHLVARAWSVPFPEGTIRRDLIMGLTVGAGVAIVHAILFRALLGALLPPGTPASEATPPIELRGVVVGVFNDALTGELILRWGVMSLLAWLLWRFLQRTPAPPRAWVMWSAIVLSTAIFVGGSLLFFPTDKQMVPVLAIASGIPFVVDHVVFGWLFWRRSLESVMAAHAMYAIVVAAVALLLSALY